MMDKTPPARDTLTKGKVVLFYPDAIMRAANAPYKHEHYWFPFPYLYLGPFLEREGYQVVVLDARVDEFWDKTLIREIADADGIGITAMSGNDLLNAVQAANIIRDTRPDLPIMWGGHHAYQLPDQLIEEGVADYAFVGHAEHNIVSIVNAIVEKTEIPMLQGVIYKNKNGDGSIVGDREAARISFDYDVFPGWHLLDIEKYRSPNNIASYFSSKGCPFKCTFCTTGDYSTSYRNMEQFELEFSHLTQDMGFKNIFLQDGTYFLSKKRVLPMAKMIKEISPDTLWKAKAKADSLLKWKDNEIQQLHDSGLRSIFYGIEHGSQRMLDHMVKNITREDALDSARMCRDFGFEYYASFIFAMPGETVDDLKETLTLIDEILAIKPDATLQNCIYLPLPGTPMYRECIDRGFEPPTTLDGWGGRNTTSNFGDDKDISWMEPNSRKEYISAYNDAFPDYKHAYEKERDGDYTSPLFEKKAS
ncbi:MAG: B12-binding domain-containing radical SAM protein [Rhodospirillaceae bacterium]|nr:B12-binding domain-containing radical SAM protein [Rhodospirillaceae bacterium]